MALPIHSRPFAVALIVSLLVAFSSALGQTSTFQKVTKLPPSEERWALVIGINKYDDPELTSLYGQNDAKRIAADLEHYAGFLHDQILLLTDDQPNDHKPRRERILWWLASLGNMSSPQGLILIYFSGHGGEIGGNSYLMPQEAHQNNNPTYLEQNALPVHLIWDTLKTTHAKQIIVLVDACRNNPYAAAGETANPMTQEFVDSFNYEKVNQDIIASITIFSTGLDQQSYQYHSKKMGFFSFVLDAALTGAAYDASGQLTLGTLIRYLQDRTPKLVKLNIPGRDQKPFVKSNEGYKEDDLVLVGVNPPPLVPIAAASAVLPPTPALTVTTPAVKDTVTASISRPLRIAGWAVGDDGTILHTDDGNSWTPQNSGSPSSTLNSVTFPTPQSGWVVGAFDTILHTEDGGATWNRQSSGTRSDSIFRSVAFATPQVGWVVGDEGIILHTDDGRNWKRQRSGTKATLRSVAFVSPQSGWAVGDEGIILHTEDGGSSWRPQSSAYKETFFCVKFATPQLGWAVGNDGTILHTEDGGLNWNSQRNPITGALFSVTFATPRSGWAVGSYGFVAHTSDGGASWDQLVVTNQPYLYSVASATPQLGWAVGYGGTIVHTKDGGATWQSQSSGVHGYLNSVTFAP